MIYFCLKMTTSNLYYSGKFKWETSNNIMNDPLIKKFTEYQLINYFFNGSLHKYHVFDVIEIKKLENTIEIVTINYDTREITAVPLVSFILYKKFHKAFISFHNNFKIFNQSFYNTYNFVSSCKHLIRYDYYDNIKYIVNIKPDDAKMRKMKDCYTISNYNSYGVKNDDALLIVKLTNNINYTVLLTDIYTGNKND